MSIPLRIIIFFAGIFLLLGVWEGVCAMTEILHFALPPPSRIAQSLWVHRERFAFHTYSTFLEMLGGFILASLWAFPLAWLMMQWKTMRFVLQPLFVVVQCIPMFALAPLMVLWFDWSYLAIVVPTALMIFFPLTMNLYRGLASTPPHLLDFFRVHRATTLQTFWKLRFPWAVPYMWAGLRISSAVAGIGAVAGEWAGAQSGLGVLMIESRRSADLEMMFGALFCLTVMSLCLYLTILGLENRRRIQGTSVLLLLLCSLSACGTSDKETTRLVLDWLPNPNHVPIYVGLNKGFFKDEGIDLEIKKIQDPADPIPLVSTGQADLAITYSSYVMRAQKKGASLLPIAILIEEPLNALIYRKDRGVKRIQDLSGKKIGYSSDGSEARLLKTLLELNGIESASLRNLQFDLVGSLAMGRVDGIYGGYWTIECEQLAFLGIETGYFTMSDLGVPSCYELVIIASKGTKSADPSFVKAFQKALQRSIDYSRENPAEALNLYFAANPDKSSATREWESRTWEKTVSVFPRSQQFNWDLWNHFQSWLAEYDLLEI
jgi:NitT/TauT family transport system substrate-binding protein